MFLINSQSKEPKLFDKLDSTRSDAIPENFTCIRDEPMVEEVFFKVGRTTGWTAGTFNSVKSTVFVEEKDYEAWLILNIEPNGAFSDGGDSGSIIFDRKGGCLALLWGGRAPVPEGYPHDLSFCTPLSIILEDIKQRLSIEDICLANKF